MISPLLTIKNLSIIFKNDEKTIHAVRRISLDLKKSETVALVGESGSGKSVTAYSIMRLLPKSAVYIDGEIEFEGKNLINMPENEIRNIRGNRIGMIFQEPMSSLNPLHTIEKQIKEILFVHQGLNQNQAREKTLELLEMVEIQNPIKRLNAFPHELSGGQRQRVMIAMALANKPDILIADEPTTALDLTVQSQVLRLIKNIQKKNNMAILLITHDFGIVKNFSDRVAVMNNGKIVEISSTKQIFSKPKHAYTKKLLESEPSGDPVNIEKNSITFVSTKKLRVWFPIKKGILKKTVDHIKAVNDLNIKIRKGHCLGIVGESGSGKSTLGLALLRLIKSEGEIEINKFSINKLQQKDITNLRKNIQIVFQDPFGSLSPRMTIEQIISEGLEVHEKENHKNHNSNIIQVLKEVGLDPKMMNRYPHEFSGGQRQRIAIARAIILKPGFLILDEPTSSLDRSVQTQVLDLLKKLQKKYKITYIFISHDIKVIKSICHEIVVMKDGIAIEFGPTNVILNQPKNTYTQSLIESAF